MILDFRDLRLYPAVIGAAVIAYSAGDHLRFSHESPGQILSIATAGSTVHVAQFFNTSTFAAMDAVPVTPPEDRQERG